MAEPADKKDKKVEVKTKRPSALKRDLQNQKRRLRNRSCRAEVLTAIKALSTKESVDSTKEKLSVIYSLMDKGVKNGVFKKNKAARTKSRLAARMSK